MLFFSSSMWLLVLYCYIVLNVLERKDCGFRLAFLTLLRFPRLNNGMSIEILLKVCDVFWKIV